MSRLIRCILSAFVLVCCLTAGSAQALPVRPAPSAVSEAASLLDAAWSWLVGRLRPVEPAAPRQDSTRQQKTGCGMDPDGKPSSCNN
jgi:hypothetical protein